MIPSEEMPCSMDPVEQAIIAANNRVMENGAHYFSTDSMPPHRARRIWQRLAELEKATVEDMAAIHRDTISVGGIEIGRASGRGRGEISGGGGSLKKKKTQH